MVYILSISNLVCIFSPTTGTGHLKRTDSHPLAYHWFLSSDLWIENSSSAAFHFVLISLLRRLSVTLFKNNLFTPVTLPEIGLK